MGILQVRLMTCWHEKRRTTSWEAEVCNSRPMLTQSLNSFSFISSFPSCSSVFPLHTCVSAVANIFGVSSGSVSNCTNRFIAAVNKLSDRPNVWPSENKRTELAVFAWSRFGFWGCIESVDVSQGPQAYAQLVQPWTWWNHHDRQSINILVVSDHNRNIIAVMLDFSGSASDAMLQQQAHWARFPVFWERCCLETREWTTRTR